MKTKSIKRLLVFSVLSLLLTETVYAESIPLSSEKSTKYFPVSVTSYFNGKEDGTIVCWLDKSGNGCLKIQKLSPSGITEWGNNGRCVCKNLNLQFSSNTDYPAIFSDNSGGAVIIYRQVYTYSEEIYSSKVSANGELIKSVCLSSASEGYNFSPASAKSGDNSITVAWENFTAGEFDIHIQKIDLNCSKLWNQGSEVVLCGLPGDQRKPSLVCDENGNSIVSWLEKRETPDSDEFAYDIYSNVINRNGDRLKFGTEGKLILHNFIADKSGINKNFSNGINPGEILKTDLFNHNMILSDNNSVIIAAGINILERDSYIKVFKISSNLDFIWEKIIDEDSFQNDPLIISDGNYGACVVWNDKRNNRNDIYAIRLSGSGEVLCGEESGALISSDIRKDKTSLYLPDKNNQSAIAFSGDKIIVPYIISGTLHLYAGGYSFLNSVEFNQIPESVSYDVNNAECVSVSYLRNVPVTIYLMGNTIFASYNFSKKITDTGNNIVSENYPNPFNPETKISYTLPVSSNVKITVYDVSGKTAALLLNQKQNVGRHEITFNGNNLSGGVYFYKIEAGNYADVKRMILLK
jgi:hypothetical protein